MVDTLNTILLTAGELFELRNKLKNLADQVKIFCGLGADLFIFYFFAIPTVFCLLFLVGKL